MNLPPLLLNVRIKGENRRFGFWLPLPLFLVLLLMVVIVVVLSPLILVGVLILWPSGWGKRCLMALGAAFTLYCAMRGLKIDFQRSQHLVRVSII